MNKCFATNTQGNLVLSRWLTCNNNGRFLILLWEVIEKNMEHVIWLDLVKRRSFLLWLLASIFNE